MKLFLFQKHLGNDSGGRNAPNCSAFKHNCFLTDNLMREIRQKRQDHLFPTSRQAMLSKDSDTEDCEVDILDLTSTLYRIWNVVWHMCIAVDLSKLEQERTMDLSISLILEGMSLTKCRHPYCKCLHLS